MGGANTCFDTSVQLETPARPKKVQCGTVRAGRWRCWDFFPEFIILISYSTVSVHLARNLGIQVVRALKYA